jgi:tetratricopeptide (TPR) repeat protein
LEAFRLIREKLEGEVELIMFGLISPPLTDFPYTYYYKPPREKLSEIYSSCDVFMATTWFEGCPMSPLEAMACKTPVVTPNSLGVMEYARDGKTVLLTERRNPAKLAEGVIKLLKDTSLRKKIMEGGYIISKEFTWERMVKELEILFSRAEKIYKRKAPQEWSPWEKVTSISQGDVWAHFKLGVSLYKLSRLEEAKKEFEFVIGENYKHPDAYKYLGKTLAKLGNLRGALLNLRKAKELLMKSR